MEKNSVIEEFSTISDKKYDKVLIYKLLSNPRLFEKLKRIESSEVFTSMKELITSDQLKVCLIVNSYNLKQGS